MSLAKIHIINDLLNLAYYTIWSLTVSHMDTFFLLVHKMSLESHNSGTKGAKGVHDSVKLEPNWNQLEP